MGGWGGAFASVGIRRHAWPRAGSLGSGILAHEVAACRYELVGKQDLASGLGADARRSKSGENAVKTNHSLVASHEHRVLAVAPRGHSTGHHVTI